MRFWREGKHNTGIFKCRLGGGKFPFYWNLYLFKYPIGSFIPWHRAHGYRKIYYFHIELWPAWHGGIFEVTDSIWSFPRRNPYFIFFRADQEYHRVTTVTSGHRLVLAFNLILY